MELQLGDGTTWTDLTPSNYTIELIDVDRVAAKRNEDVTEKASFHALKSDATAEAAIKAAQQWFDLARQRQVDISLPRIFIRQKLNGDSGWWRAEVKDGLAQSDTSTRQALGGVSRFTLSWTREATLYSETETQAGATTTLYNTYAGGNSNILNIGQGTAAVLTPMRLSIVNNNVANLSKIYAGIYRSRSSITTSTLGAATTLEAESGTVINGAGTSTASGSASNGNYRAFSWSGATETDLIKWSLSSTSLSYLGARAWRVFSRVTAAPTNVTRMRASLRYGSLVVSQTELAPVSGSALLEMPALMVPPYEANAASYTALDLVISAIGSGTNVLNLDAVHLMPTDSYRVYSSPGGYLAQNETLNDSPNAGVVHSIASSAVRTSFAAIGKPLMLGLNSYAALMVLMIDSTGAAGIGLNVSASCYTQQRRKAAI